MSIVIDINTLCSVFKSSDDNHHEFKPVFEFLMFRGGVWIYGGKKYREELYKLTSLLTLVRLLKDKRIALEIDDHAVDNLENKLKNSISDKDCDDHHIIALLDASSCDLLCSRDKRSYKFIKDRSNYRILKKKVKIYSDARCISLLRQRELQMKRRG